MGRTAVLMIASAGWLVALGAAPRAASPETIVVRLSNFAITPETLHLPSGRMVLLRIVNDSSGGHDLSAPALFSAGTFPGGAAPAGGKIEVASRQSRDVLFVPGVAGNYRVECTHFLHSLFGMSGKVVVDGPER
jgi:plastocyanin